MENSTAERVKKLRAHYDLSVKEFAGMCGLSHVAIFHIENGKTLKPHKSSLIRMAAVFGTTLDWLIYGRDEMLPQGTKELNDDGTGQENFWSKEACLELKSRNQLLEKDMERLWLVVNQLSGIAKSKFELLDAG
jgi:transcriptional regulator with XRE-family HTH domain